MVGIPIPLFIVFNSPHSQPPSPFEIEITKQFRFNML